MKKQNTGCIYTKDWVVRFLLDCCGYTEEKNLTQLRVIEPSCGNGNFTTAIVKRLCTAAKRNGIQGIKLADCLCAYDVDAEALQQARNRAYDVLSSYGYAKDAENLVKGWFVESDFVIAAVEKADLVVGNPPYVRATEISEEIRKQYTAKLQTFTRGTDLYMAFLEQGIRALTPEGKLCFLCSDRWQKNKFGTKFREWLQEQEYHISLNLQLHEADVFEKKVVAYPAITILQKTPGPECFMELEKKFSEECASELAQSLLKKSVHWKSGAPEIVKTSEEIFPLLEDTGVSIGIGIATGRDCVFVTENPNCVETDRLLPLAYAKNIQAADFPKKPEKWLVNPWKEGQLVDLREYPRLQNYFRQHEEELRQRYIAIRNPKAWYRTIDKVKEHLEQQEKLLIRDIATKTEPVYEDGRLYPHHNLYWITSEAWDLKVLGGILLSDTVQEMMNCYSVKMRGGALRNQAQYLRKLRVPRYESIDEVTRDELRSAFIRRDRKVASAVCAELYGGKRK